MRLTPEDEKAIRSAPCHVPDVFVLLAEIDALRAELAKANSTMEECERSLYLRINELETANEELVERIDVHLKEIATFRNASPSLCNCCQCLDMRTT